MPTSAAKKVHISLHVNNLQESVAFYGRIFGTLPDKHYEDYAKFDLDDPGLVLSLGLAKEGETRGLNHLGVKLDNRNELIEWTSKAAERGLEFQHLDNVSCCYADQSKIFMNDPDGILFEVYNVNKDLEPSSTTTMAPAIAKDESRAAESYEHLLPGLFPEDLGFADGQLQKIALRGTLNARLSNAVYYKILSECFRVLADGGELVIHMLTADVEPSGDLPVLPEPASHVRRIPSEDLVWNLVREAGFVGLEAQRLSPHHVFEFKGSRFRELLLKASKRGPLAENSTFAVYKGPFPRVELESGMTFERGVRTTIAPDVYSYLSTSAYKQCFAFLNDAGQSCGN